MIHRSIARRYILLLAAALLVTTFALYLRHSNADAGAPGNALQSLKRENATIGRSAQSGKIKLIGAPSGTNLGGAGIFRDLTPVQAARTASDRYGRLFGLHNPSKELKVSKTYPSNKGGNTVRMRQYYKGLPVIGGELVVNLTRQGDLKSLAGEAATIEELSIEPRVSPGRAGTQAVTRTASVRNFTVNRLRFSEPELAVFDASLLGPDKDAARLVWKVLVSVRGNSPKGSPINELVLVDAKSGKAILNFSQIRNSMYREIYDMSNSGNRNELPGTLICSENGTNVCTEGLDEGDRQSDRAYWYARDFYDFFATVHGRDSWDGLGGKLILSVFFGLDETGQGNAFWVLTPSGLGMAVFSYGFPRADDVVAHELTHGVTAATSQLFYYYQSGAIDESMSDMWGEFIDQSNDTVSDDANKWLLGEDILDVGAIRSMRDPTETLPSLLWNGPHPDRMTSPYYWRGEGDNGGVHSNSGINNKAVYLMAEGGVFNGQTVDAIGVEKTAKIYYQAQTHYLTQGSDYSDLYLYLQQSCDDLIGIDGISKSDCVEAKDALDAVEMGLPVPDNFMPGAAFCPKGQELDKNVFYDDMEVGDSVKIGDSGSSWGTSTIAGSTTKWAYAEGIARAGRTALYGDTFRSASDTNVFMRWVVKLPAGAYFRFNHMYGFEGVTKDGGVVEYSVSGGAWTDARPLYDAGQDYSKTMDVFTLTPGRWAFVSDSHGYVSTRYDLASMAGKEIRFRFRQGTNASGESEVGWAIDDVRIYTCKNIPPLRIDKGAEKTSTRDVELKLESHNVEFSTGDAGSSRDVTHVRFVNDSTADAGKWSSWLPYAKEKDWTLSAGDGFKIVFAQFKDVSGEASKVYSDRIFLDTRKLELKTSAAWLIPFGTWVKLSGTLKTGAGNPVAGKTVILQYWNGDDWVTFKTAGTDSAGSYQRWALPGSNIDVRAVVAADSAYTPSLLAYPNLISREKSILLKNGVWSSLSSSVINYKDMLRIYGAVGNARGPLGMKPMTLQTYNFSTGTWITGDVKYSNSSGDFTWTLVPEKNARYRIKSYDNFTYSKTMNVYVRQGVKFYLTRLPNSSRAGSFYTKVSPAHAYRKVSVQRYSYSKKQWQWYKTVQLNSLSEATFQWKPSSRGYYKFRVCAPKHSDHAKGCSLPVAIKVE